MRIKIIVLLCIIFSTNLFSQKYKNIDVPYFDSIQSINFNHVNITLSKDEKTVKKGQEIGKIQDYPFNLSANFDMEIRLSNNAYDKGDFTNARMVLEKAIVLEPNNKFILNAYARASYKKDRETSYRIYEKLVKLLDSEDNCTRRNVIVDMWFQEAYWKYGTLLMDHEKWLDAKFEISRFLLSIQDAQESIVYIQALQYLTECAYSLYDDNTAIYLAKRTLFYDKNNDYAKEIIGKLKKK